MAAAFQFTVSRIMQKVGIVVVLLASAVTNCFASDDEVTKAKALVALAKDKDLQFIARLAAIDELGKVKPAMNKDLKQTLLDSLADLLKACDVREYEDNCYRLHVVQAIGNIGPDLAMLAPNLIQYVGSERILDEAVADSLRKIRPVAPITPQVPKNNVAAPPADPNSQ
jgi:hypothetical protein